MEMDKGPLDCWTFETMLRGDADKVDIEAIKREYRKLYEAYRMRGNVLSAVSAVVCINS
jgi:hypothetical protein